MTTWISLVFARLPRMIAWGAANLVLLLLVLPACAQTHPAAVAVQEAIGKLADPRRQGESGQVRLKPSENLPSANSTYVSQACALIKAHPDAETLPLLVGELEAHDPIRVRAAAYLVGMLTWENPQLAFPGLRRMLLHRDPGVRAQAAISLSSLGDEACYDTLVEMITHDENPFVRQYVAWSLGELGHTKAIDILKSLPEDEEANVRDFVRVAIERLEFIRDRSTDEQTVLAARAISRIAGSSEDQVFRIESAIKALRPLEPSAAKQLLKSWASDGRYPTIRSSAAFALERLQ